MRCPVGSLSYFPIPHSPTSVTALLCFLASNVTFFFFFFLNVLSASNICLYKAALPPSLVHLHFFPPTHFISSPLPLFLLTSAPTLFPLHFSFFLTFSHFRYLSISLSTSLPVVICFCLYPDLPLCLSSLVSCRQYTAHPPPSSSLSFPLISPLSSI